MPRVAAALGSLTATIAAAATGLGLDPMPTRLRGPHLLGVRLPASIRSAILPALAAANCFAAVRGESLRIAPHLHVTDVDVRCLTDALAAAL